MKQFISFLIFWLFTIQLYSQQRVEQKIDSLLANSNYQQAIGLIQGETTKNISFQNKEAEALMGLGKLSEAESLLSQISSNDYFENGITQNNLGYLNLLKGRNDLAQDHLEKARDYFRTSQKENSKEAAKCFSNISLLFWSTGKYNEAEENGLIALQIRQTIFGNESEETAASLNDLGLVYGSSDPDKGLEYYEKALSIYEKIYAKDNAKIAIANTNIG